MKELESHARLIQGVITHAAHTPISSSRVLEAARAYHTNIRMLGLEEMTLSGLINQVGDVRGQGPPDALVMAVSDQRMSKSSNPDDSAADPPVPATLPPGGKRLSFKNVLFRQAYRASKGGAFDAK